MVRWNGNVLICREERKSRGAKRSRGVSPQTFPSGQGPISFQTCELVLTGSGVPTTSPALGTYKVLWVIHFSVLGLSKGREAREASDYKNQPNKPRLKQVGRRQDWPSDPSVLSGVNQHLQEGLPWPPEASLQPRGKEGREREGATLSTHPPLQKHKHRPLDSFSCLTISLQNLEGKFTQQVKKKKLVMFFCLPLNLGYKKGSYALVRGREGDHRS